MLVSLTVGKVDAGVAVLLTEDKRLVRKIQASLNLKLKKRGDPRSCQLVFPLLTCSLDRVPVNTPSFIYNLRLNSGHHSCAKSSGRAESGSFIQRSSRKHPKEIWPCLPICTKPPLARRDADIRCTRMGPNTTCDIHSEVTLTLQKQQQSRQHTSSIRHVQHQNQRPCNQYGVLISSCASHIRRHFCFKYTQCSDT